MRRLLSASLLLGTAFAAAAVLSTSAAAEPPRVMITLPGTNTPSGVLAAFVTATPSSAPAAFVTNTPSARLAAFATVAPNLLNDPTDPPVPTRQPSATATLTLTPTATFTASNTPTLTPSPTLTPTFTPTPNGPFEYPEGISPLTGMAYTSDAARDRRNLIVKISNHPPIVRPQSGVNQADVVWEYEVEGGVTRFAAIYRNNAPTSVGPVRSGRLMDLQLAPMYNALLAYSGASEPIQRMILSAPWQWGAITPSRGDNCEEAGFCRFPQGELPYEHTLYADTNLIWARATQRQVNDGRRARGFAFGVQPGPGGERANDVLIEWYGQTDARWQWDADAGRYVRFTEGLPHIDRADGEQLWADNLIIVEAEHTERPDLFEPESRSASHQIEIWGEGRAYLFRDGQYYEGFWRRRCRNAPPEATATPEGTGIDYGCGSEPGDALQIVYADGTPIPMKPGRTWVTVTRWLNYVTVSEEAPNAMATANVLLQTPTVTPWPTPIR